MKKVITTLVFVGLTLSSAIAQQKTTSADIARIMSCMRQHSCKNTILTQSFDNLGEVIVFIDNGKRYSFYLSGKDAPEGFLSISVRPEGTSDQASLFGFADFGLDGSVDSAAQGPANWTDSRRKLFKSEKNPIAPATNLQFRQYWQNQFDEAIAAAKRSLFTSL